jgi:hypothetical protein
MRRIADRRVLKVKKWAADFRRCWSWCFALRHGRIETFPALGAGLTSLSFAGAASSALFLAYYCWCNSMVATVFGSWSRIDWMEDSLESGRIKIQI